MSYQDVVDLTEDREPQNPIQDNMENYRKLLSLGKQRLLQSLDHFLILFVMQDIRVHGNILEC